MLKFNFVGKDKVDILGVDFKIAYKNIEERDNPNMGIVDTKLGIIYLSTQMPDDIAEETLLHEIIHAISDKLHLELSEKKVTALSSGLYAVFKSNQE